MDLSKKVVSYLCGFVVSFLWYLIISKIQRFLEIISNLSQVFHVFISLYKDKLKVQHTKVQHEHVYYCALPVVFHFYVALFIERL